MAADARITVRSGRVAGYLFAVLVLYMLAAGLASDVLNLVWEHPPEPTRLIYPEVLAWLVARPHAALAVVIVELFASLGLTLAGLAFLVRARFEPAFRTAALICAIGVLDDAYYILVPRTVLDLYLFLYWFVLLAAFVRLTSRFPARLAPEDLVTNRGHPLTRRIERAVARTILSAPVLWGSAAALGIATWLTTRGGGSVPAGLGVGNVAYVLALTVAAAYLARVGYRRATPERRRRALWLTNAVLVYLYGFLITQVGSFVLVAFGVGPAVRVELVAGLTYDGVVTVAVAFLLFAIFYDGLADPAWAIERTTVFATLGLLVALAFAVLQTAFAEKVMELVPLPRNVVVSAVGTSAVVFLLYPVRRRIEAMCEPISLALARSLDSEATLVSARIDSFGRWMSVARADAMRSFADLRREARRLARPGHARLVPAPAGQVMLCFRDAGAGIAAARALESRFREVSTHRPPAPAGESGASLLATAWPPELAIGVHHGPVVPFRGGQLLGETVEEVLFLQRAASPGEIRLGPGFEDLVPPGSGR